MYWGFQTKKQAALPQGIVPFVFAKEYNVHPDILSTAWVFTYLLFSSFYLFLLPFAYISLNELQCYFWDANSIAHNTCLLHFVGIMKWLKRIKKLWHQCNAMQKRTFEVRDAKKLKPPFKIGRTNKSRTTTQSYSLWNVFAFCFFSFS